MHKIGGSCAFSIAAERFQQGIFLTHGNFWDEKSMNSLTLVSCPSRIFVHVKEGVQ